MKKKPHSKKNGLSDKELITKYEAGKINLKGAVKKMLSSTSPTTLKKIKAS